MITTLSPATLVAPAPGIYIPNGWGATWRSKRNAAAAAKAVIACSGSSITQGFYASNLRTKSWPGLLRTAVQAAYGDGGSGYESVTFTSPYLTAVGASGADITAYAAQLWTFVHTFGASAASSQTSGPACAGIFVSGANTSGAKATTLANLRGSTIKIFVGQFPSGTATQTQWTVLIDTVSQGTTAIPNAAGTATTIFTQSYTPGAGTHTVEFDAAGANGTIGNIWGVSAENATGVVVNQFGAGALGSGNWISPDPNLYGPPIDWSGGQYYPADLVILDLTVNDAGKNLSAATWESNSRNVLQRLRDYGAGAGPVDIILLLNHMGNVENLGSPPSVGHEYAAIFRGLAEAYGAALIDMWAIYRTSWNYANSLSYWGTAGSAGGGAGTDAIHPSDIGHQLIANAIIPVVLS